MVAQSMLLLTLVGALCSLANAVVVQKCDFVQALKDAGINQADWGTWTCIADHESHFDTDAINSDTGDYGILQISSIYWCENGPNPGNGCDITCQSLLVDDIQPSIKCALTVFDQTVKQGKDGFSAWTTYQYCQGDQSGYLDGC